MQPHLWKHKKDCSVTFLWLNLTICKILRLSKNFFFPSTDSGKGSYWRFSRQICKIWTHHLQSSSGHHSVENRPRPLIHLFLHHRYSQHICLEQWISESCSVKSALHLQKVLHVVFASNYVACIAGLSDHTTKGLQALHYTLSFLCKRGNKPPRKLQHRNHTASYKEKKKRKQQKNTSLNTESFLVLTAMAVKI